ncbi:MAG: porphobilinogen synthase [Candidatus Omnitrophica bacterium]|nr:porphobilinogen synthase [Candidatus Omnitrophota bacterium]
MTRHTYRPRRMRQNEPLRSLLRETHLSASQLVMPLFVRSGKHIRSPIPSMPGHAQLSVDQAVKECQGLRESGVNAVLLFGLSDRKDEKGSGAYARDGVVQQAVQAIKAAVPGLVVITDVCLCAYTSHGHCGIVRTRQKVKGKRQKRTRGTEFPSSLSERGFWIDNDATLELIARTAVSHAKAGADLVAPSDMMDGNVGAVRRTLDEAGFERVPIMAYSVKFASAFYAPFRQAVDSAPQLGDRRSYQMDCANSDEALREARLDIEQGADILMVKPALAYLDIIRRIKQELRHPVAAFSVSGEYAMVKAAASRGWVAERPIWFEILLALKRAGADILITYWAKDAARHLREQ